MPRHPDFIGIGAPKCATTWLFHQLSHNPRVFVPEQKELHYFSDWKYRPEDFARYARNFDGADPQQLCGEICVDYFAAPMAPQRVRAHLPDARVFVLLRNPADMVYSLFWHLRRQNFHEQVTEELSFEDALIRFRHRLLPPAKYGTNLQRWLAFFGDQMRVFFVDRVRSSPQQVFDEISDFIAKGNSNFRNQIVMTRDVRASAQPRPFTSRIYRHLYSFATRRVYGPARNILGTEQADQWKERLRIRPLVTKLFFSGRVPAMAATTRVMLLDELSREIDMTEQLLRVDLSHWRV